MGHPISITIQNDSSEDLISSNFSLNHGSWTTEPNFTIGVGASNSFAAEASAVYGPQGQAQWTGAKTKQTYTISFTHPLGSGSTTVTASTPNGLSYNLQNDQLQHHDASCTIEFYTKVGPLLNQRQNQKSLTQNQISNFVQAVKQLKQSGVYDQFVILHKFANRGPNAVPSNWAHMNPLFLPWHRVFLALFENELQKINPEVTLPYWDWTVDSSPDPSVNPLFSDAFMGPVGDKTQNWQVMTGPFSQQAGWDLGTNDFKLDGAPTPATYLQRFMGNSPGSAFSEAEAKQNPIAAAALSARGIVAGSAPAQVAYSLPTLAQLTAVLASTSYDLTPYDRTVLSFRNELEGWISPNQQGSAPFMHNLVHMWVGGSMQVFTTSPNDPLFFVHHAFVDYIWAKWAAQSTTVNPYLPTNDAQFPQYGIDRDMAPWDGNPYTFSQPVPAAVPAGIVYTPQSVISTSSFGYTYDTL